MPTDDNDPAPRATALPVPDPHGQAALLLVESLIHGLLARSLIDIGDAIDIAETAASVQAEVAGDADGAGAPMWQAHTLLAAILGSLKVDDTRETATPTAEP